jgi:ABC-type Fe3+/spermidine/putrescine transport system ATPase subunit
VLLDERVSNLDASLRDRLRQEASQIPRTAGVTALSSRTTRSRR